MTDHQLQKPLWDLEWKIVGAEEWAFRCDQKAIEAWEQVGELKRQLDEMLAEIVEVGR